MHMAGLKRSAKWLWILGVVVWVSAVSILLWRLPNAQSYAQASSYETRLLYISLFMVFWGIAPAIFKAMPRQTRTSQS